MRSTELAREADVSIRRIDYWTRLGYLRPVVPARGSGSQRHFSPDEVAVARVLAVIAPFHSYGSLANNAHIRSVCERVRAGGRGLLTFVAGVLLDLDVLCDPPPALESVA